MDIKNKAIKGVKWNVLNNIISVLVGILRLAILTRLLDKSDFGIIALSTSIIEFTTIFSDLGLTSALIHKQNISEVQYSSVFWMNMLMGSGIFVLICIFTPFVSFVYGESILNTIIPLLGLQVFITGFGKMFQTIKTKQMEFDFISKVSILSNVLGLIVTTVFALCGLGVYSLVFGQLFIVSFTQIIYSVSGYKQHKIHFVFKYIEIKDFIKIGGYQLGSQLLDFLSARIDIFIMGKFFTMEDLGVYNIAKTLVLMPYRIINSIVSNVGTSAFALIQNDIDKVKSGYEKIVRLMSSINYPVYVILFVFASPIVQVLYAPQFCEVSRFLQILVLWGFLSSTNSLVGMVLIAKGRTDLGFYWTWIRVLLTSFFVLIACNFSVYAIAYSQTVVGILSFFIYFYMVVKPIVKLSLCEYLNCLKISGLLSIIPAVPFFIVMYLMSIPTLIGILLIFIYILLYFSFQWIYNKEFVSSNLKSLIANNDTI